MTVAIIGAGQAGAQTAMSLRSEGYEGRIVLFGDEPHAPYQRPPLSKSFFKELLNGDNPTPDMIAIQPLSAYEQDGIELRVGEEVRKVNLENQTVTTSKETLEYDSLVFATGSAPRRLPSLDRNLFHEMRTLDDITELANQATNASRIVILGGGFIGLEAASVFGSRGSQVTILEAAPRLLGRGASPETGEKLTQLQRDNGVTVELDCQMQSVTKTGDKLTIATNRDTLTDVDLLIVGIGAIPRDELAREAGLETTNGIVVDETLQAHPNVYAIGDVANFPLRFALQPMRLESLQNATDQARHIAKSISSGIKNPYEVVPWFWTEQWGVRLQIAGIIDASDEFELVAAPRNGWSVFAWRKGYLAAVESAFNPAEHMAARRLLAQPQLVSRSEFVAAQGNLAAVFKNRQQAT